MAKTYLKARYGGKKRARAISRERLVLKVLSEYLPRAFTAELSGFGAGRAERLRGWHVGPLQAFDIVVRFNGRPCCFVEVTGVPGSRKKKPGLGYCVGLWKIEKAERYGLEHVVWVAMVIDDEAAILWAPIRRVLAYGRPGLIYEDEDEHFCMEREKWLKIGRFIDWLIEQGHRMVPLVEEAVRRHAAG